MQTGKQVKIPAKITLVLSAHASSLSAILVLKISILQGGQRTAIKTELIQTCSRYATVVRRGKYFKKL